MELCPHCPHREPHITVCWGARPAGRGLPTAHPTAGGGRVHREEPGSTGTGLRQAGVGRADHVSPQLWPGCFSSRPDAPAGGVGERVQTDRPTWEAIQCREIEGQLGDISSTAPGSPPCPGPGGHAGRLGCLSQVSLQGWSCSGNPSLPAWAPVARTTGARTGQRPRPSSHRPPSTRTPALQTTSPPCCPGR